MVKVLAALCTRCGRSWDGPDSLDHMARHQCRRFRVRWVDVWVYAGTIGVALALLVWAWFV